ncbi:MAG: hypothetical protein E7598_01985 [Ruminococcaceae bacterium]|nr:hypothetical protein [Oscillospiraceae bacterium]
MKNFKRIVSLMCAIFMLMSDVSVLAHEMLGEETEIVETSGVEETVFEEDFEETYEEDFEETTFEETIEVEETGTADEDIDEDISLDDPEAELEGLFDHKCGKHYVTKSKNVTYYKSAKKKPEKKGTFSAKGTLLILGEKKEVTVKKVLGIPVKDTYYYVEDGNGHNGWVLSDNIKKHECTENSPKVTYSYKQIKGNDKYHKEIKKTAASKCTVCGCKVNNAKETSSNQKHSWAGAGICSVKGCSYEFDYSENNIWNFTALVTKKVDLKKKPYSDAANKNNGSLDVNDSVTITHKTKNCYGNIWYKVEGGGWIYEDNVEKHSHSYSSSTGKCSCGAMYKYPIDNESITPYQPKSGKVTARKDPFKSSTEKKTYSGKVVININASTYSEPNKTIIKKGDKWFKTTDGYWILASEVKEHKKSLFENQHEYSQESLGECIFENCSYVAEYEKHEWLHPITCKFDVYEANNADTVARSKAYSKATAKKTYKKWEIVKVDYRVKNVFGEWWYRTSDGYWVKDSQIKHHSHHMSAGECTSKGCGYIKDIGLKSITATLYESNKQTLVRQKPFGDAPAQYELLKNKTVKIDGYTTKLDEKWYKTTDGYYVCAADIAEHKHSYKQGLCNICGKFEKYTTVSITPTIVETKKANVKRYSKPYSLSSVKNKYIQTGEQLVILEQATNSLGEKWYKNSFGEWVLASEVKVPKGSSVKKANKTKVSDYIITVTDNKNNPIVGATVECLGLTVTTNADGNAELIYATGKAELKITAPDYDDHINNSYTMNSNMRDSITLSLAGSYEAVKVNMTYLYDTVDLLKESKTINHFHSYRTIHVQTMDFECVMSNTDNIKEYRLVQGGKVKATSTDGKFENIHRWDFEAKKTVELWVYDKTGNVRAKQKLLLNVFNETKGDTKNSIGFTGGGFAISIDADFPLIGGAEFELALPVDLPVSVTVGDESTVISVNLDIGKDKKKDETNGEKNTPAAKKIVKKFINDFKEYRDGIKDLTSTKWKKLYKKYAIKNETVSGKGNFKFNKPKFCGEFEIMHGQNVCKGKIVFEFSATGGCYWHVQAGPVPVLVEIEVEGSISPTGTFTLTDWKFTDAKLLLDGSVSIEASVGVGFKYVASVSLYGKAALNLESQLLPYDSKKTNIYLYGNVGIKAKVLGTTVANLNIFSTPSLYIMKDGVYMDPLLGPIPTLQEALFDSSKYVQMDRGYLENRSGWYGADEFELFDEDVSIVVSDLDFDVLQSSTYTDIKPQVVTAGGVIMMVFTDDNASRADADRTMLVYSIYDPATKVWSAPKAVNDDTTADYGFKVATFEDQIYIVWQNAKTLNAADATLTELAKNTDLTIAKYNPLLDEFVYVEQITNNDIYEMMPRIASVNGEIVITWVTNTVDNVFGAEGENVIHYAYKQDAAYAPVLDGKIDTSDITDEELEEAVEPTNPDELGEGEEAAEEEEPVVQEWTYVTLDPIADFITSLAAGYMLEDGYIAYTTDEDGNTATEDDQYIRLVKVGTTDVIKYTNKAMNVEFTKVHGDNAMTWYNRGMIYYSIDPAYAPQQLYIEPTSLGDGYNLISDENGNMAVLFTKHEEETSDAYLMLFDDETFEWGLPIRVTNQDKYINDFSGAYSGGTIVSIFNQTELNATTDINNLCTAIIGERHDMAVTEALFDDYNLVPGEEKALTVTVTNNGTIRTSSVKVTVYDGDTVVDEKVIEKAIKPGYSETIETTVLLPAEISRNTYRVEVEEPDCDDAYYVNNKAEITIGRAVLHMSAESSPTATENIVVLNVTNEGYEPSGGKIVLLDENGAVIDTLIEQFDPIDHGETFSCAIIMEDSYFNDELGRSFDFAVIADAEQDTTAYNSAGIYVKNIAATNTPQLEVGDVGLFDEVDSDAALFETTVKTVSATVKNESETDIENGQVLVSIYDRNGLYVDTYSETVSLAAGETASVTAEFVTDREIVLAKIVLVDGATMLSYTGVTEIRLGEDNSEFLADEEETESEETETEAPEETEAPAETEATEETEPEDIVVEGLE